MASNFIASKSVWIVLANQDCPIERVGCFENLEPQIWIDLVGRQPCVYCGLRIHTVLERVLSTDEGSQPCTEKEDLSVLLDVFEFVERLHQVLLCEPGLVPRIERTQALRDPVFLDCRGVEVFVEIALLRLGGWSCCFGGIRIFQAFAALVMRLLRRVDCFCFRIAHRDQVTYEIPTVKALECHAGHFGFSRKKIFHLLQAIR